MSFGLDCSIVKHQKMEKRDCKIFTGFLLVGFGALIAGAVLLGLALNDANLSFDANRGKRQK